MIRRLLNIPFILWILIAGGLAGKQYYDWNTTVNAQLDSTKIAKEAELAGLKNQTAKIEEFKKKKQQKLAQLQELGEKFRATADRLPRTSAVPELLKILADIGDKAGLQFTKFRPQPPQPEQFLVITPLEVTLRGTYIQVMSFLDATAHTTRVVSASKLLIEEPKSRGPVTTLNVQVTLRTYHIEDKDVTAQ